MTKLVFNKSSKVENKADKPTLKVKPNLKVGRKGDSLHGSGLTKKLFVSSEKKQTKIVNTGLKLKPKSAKAGSEVKQPVTAKLTIKTPVDKADPQTTEYLAAKEEDKQLTNQPKLVDFGTREISEAQLDDDQRTAVAGMHNNQYACLIGSAGTGKTTTSKALVRRLQANLGTINSDDALPPSQRGKKPGAAIPAIAFCAFTGRAVEQLKKALPTEYHSQCSTIHALLGYAPTMEIREPEDYGGLPREVKVFRPIFNSFTKLPHKVIVIDETGMLSVPLFNELMEAVTSDCRIYMMGDINQLPPVQGRSVLGYAMNSWPTYELTKVHRTALDNPVIANAHRILKGQMPKKDSKHFLMMELEASAMKASTQVEAAIKKLHQADVFNELTDALLVPQNTSMLGQENLNSKLLSYFNPPRKEDGVTVNPRVKIKSAKDWALLAVGDKIMNTQNDRQKGLTNGMTGVVTDIRLNDSFKSLGAYQQAMEFSAEDFDMDSLDVSVNHEVDAEEEQDANERQASHVTTVEWENGSTTELSTCGQYNNLLHAYAFTGHKSQGGEYDTVVIVVHSSNSAMLCREWLYTTVTRAKKRVVLLSNYRGLSQAVNRQRIKGKTLEEKAAAFRKWADNAIGTDKEDDLPYLPTPKQYEAAE